MKKHINALTLFFALALLVSLTACDSRNGKYREIEKLADYELCVGFRQGDKAGQAVVAAMKELQSEGVVEVISRDWFGDDYSILEGDEDAIESLGFEIEERDFLIGYDAERLPFSGDSGSKQPVGFDIDFAKAVCDKLGWRAKFIPIDVANAEIELNSGDVDCVWGAFAYNDTYKNIQQSPVYMKNTVVVAALGGTNIRSLSSLDGKTLMHSNSMFFEGILEDNPDLKSRPEFTVSVPGGSKECFKSLNDGACDAIITDRLALDYYR